jgi:alpha-L-fucosidase 2
LLQSQGGEIELLPALPAAWASGHVSGLRARGGFEIEIAWDNHKLTSAKILSTSGEKAVVRYGDHTTEIQLKNGKSVQLNADLKK